MIQVLVLLTVVLAMSIYCWWLYHRLNLPIMSGDKFYMRQFAYTNFPITAPYRWRPLLPWLARIAGFKGVSYVANAITPFVIFYYAGMGWAGFCCALIFVMNPHIFPYNVRNPEYVEGLGHLLLALTVVAMSTGHWAMFPLAFLCALTRETLTAVVGLLALFVNPLLLLPLGVGSVISWFARAESKENSHPLIEDTYYGTIARWVKNKDWNAFAFAHTILPLRGTPIAVPFVWGAVGDFARLGLIGFIPIWLFALPASGQNRIMCYGYILVVPFLAALSMPWLGFITLLACLWPVDWKSYDEAGDTKFAFIR